MTIALARETTATETGLDSTGFQVAAAGIGTETEIPVATDTETSTETMNMTTDDSQATGGSTATTTRMTSVGTRIGIPETGSGTERETEREAKMVDEPMGLPFHHVRALMSAAVGRLHDLPQHHPPFARIPQAR
jgi:hypothetical protein